MTVMSSSQEPTSATAGHAATAGKLGQLVVTGERVVGMMTRGSAGRARLDDSAGSWSTGRRWRICWSH
jgi:hypothetical protein